VSEAPALVLLTIAYPFGNRVETFLETEIEVLAERFPRVYVLPSHREPGLRPLPAGAELVEMEWLERPPRGAVARALASPEAARVARWTAAGGGLRPHLRAPRAQLDNLGRNVLKSRALARFAAERDLGEAVFYDYWFENSTLALALLRAAGAVGTAVCRAHGFDLWDERWRPGTVPFREAKAHGLDAVFAVSAAGAAYLEERSPGLRGKVSVRRLGVRDPGRACPPPRPGEPPLIVTCAGLSPAKHVDLVPEALAALDRPLRWVHLGDGPERGRVEAAAERLLGERVEWELRGHVDNAEVLDLYASEHVAALLSLSGSEGLPVSMMEAQSYGIPIVARAVGGVPEIVNERTGVPLGPAATPAEAAAALREALAPGRFEPDAVRAEFQRCFNASVNYNGFVDAVLSLRDATRPPN
jgi:colanic acid/amylovoran biosynthesis glycosyltransferase